MKATEKRKEWGRSMNDNEFNNMVQKRRGYQLALLLVLRLVRALRQVVEIWGEEGGAALDAHWKEQEEMDRIKSGESFTKEEAGRAMQEIMRRAGVNQ